MNFVFFFFTFRDRIELSCTVYSTSPVKIYWVWGDNYLSQVLFFYVQHVHLLFPIQCIVDYWKTISIICLFVFGFSAKRHHERECARNSRLHVQAENNTSSVQVRNRLCLPRAQGCRSLRGQECKGHGDLQTHQDHR